MATHNQLGKDGEEAAARYLEDNGYFIVDRNWRSGKKEIDIVAIKDDELAFVEVKTRTSEEYSSAVEAIDLKKMKLLAAAANNYLNCHDYTQSARFDIIAAIYENYKFKIEHIENAFYPPLHGYHP